MKKFFIGIIMLLLVTMTDFNLVSAAQGFKDVSDTHWAKGQIEYLAEEGIVAGYPDGRFGVQDNVTRLQAAAMIVRALNLDTNNRPNPNFADVEEGDYGYGIVSAIADEGVIVGIEGEFRPKEPLTRAQMASILVRAFNLEGTSDYNFVDVAETNWASKAIKTLFNHRITAGYSDNTFRPNHAITRTEFSALLAKVLNPKFKEPLTCSVPNNTKKHIVNVAVTTLWAEPNTARAIDAPVVSKPVNLAKWSNQLSYQQKLWTLGKIDSQALYGQEVTILGTKGNWHKIAVKDQSMPNSKNGYIGWVPKSHITEYYPNFEDCNIAIVTSQNAQLYNDKETSSSYLEVSFNTILPVINSSEKWVQVKTPEHTTKYLKKQDVKIVDDFNAISKPSQQDLVTTAKKFLNLPYMWGGTSGYGFDCSGYTHSIYKQHGILIPRDSSVQAKNGLAVAKSDLQPGDLLFYSYNKGKGAVHHVSMYIGNGQMIHAPKYSKSVEIISINQEPYKSEFSGARRYLK